MANPKQMKPVDPLKTDVNVLLLGETGVGKSTFINAFVNYLQYEKLESALASELFCLIPTKFTIHQEASNGDITETFIKIGEDANEDQEVGNSSTQGAKAYLFPLKDNKRLRLIDTPGIGDARGLEQDNVNFENILSYISQFSHLHAICFLLKPNHTVLTAYFKFCIQHLLSRLDKSAGKNIIFIFTNSQASFYKPGETVVVLRKLLGEIKDAPPHVDIPCDKSNSYCFDNEAFRYLAAVKKEDLKFDEKEKIRFSESWDKSVKSCNELIEKITDGMIGHNVASTLSVNEARRVIINLAKPLADICEVIESNLTLLKRHEKEIMQGNMTLDELKSKLYIPVINIKQTSLSLPIMVCTTAKCSEVHTVAGINKHHYKEPCHKPCMCSQTLETNIIGSPDLLSCQMFGNNKACKKCGCDYSTHMRILYETEMVFDKLEDSSVKDEIDTIEDAIEIQNGIIERIKSRINQYDEENIIISKSLTKFARFLQQNSISMQNDAYGDYIEYLIERENAMGPQRDKDLIMRYQCLKIQHEREKEILEEIENSASSQIDDSILSATNIDNIVQKLYDLDFSGKKIHELHKKQEKVRQKDHMEYVHIGLSKKNKKKDKGNKSKLNIVDLIQNLQLEGKEALLKKLLKDSPSEENSDDDNETGEEPDKNKFVPNKNKKDYKNKNQPFKNKERQLKTASKKFLNSPENSGENKPNNTAINLNHQNIPKLFDVSVRPPNVPNQFGNNAKQFGNNQGQFGNNQNLFGPNQFRGNQQPFPNNQQQFGYNQQQIGNNPQQFANNPQQFGSNPQQIGNNPQQVVNNPQHFGNNPQNFGNNPQQFGNNSQQTGNNPQQFGNNQQSYGNNQQQFGNNQQQFGSNQQFGNNQQQFGNNQQQFPNKQHQFRNTQVFGNDQNSPNQFGNNPQFGQEQNQFGNTNSQINNAPNQFPNQPGSGFNPNNFGNNSKPFRQPNNFGNNQQPNQMKNNHKPYNPNADNFNRQFSNASTNSKSNCEFVKKPNQPKQQNKKQDNQTGNKNSGDHPKMQAKKFGGSNPNLFKNAPLSEKTKFPKQEKTKGHNEKPKTPNAQNHDKPKHSNNPNTENKKSPSGAVPKVANTNAIKKHKDDKKPAENKKKQTENKGNLHEQLLKTMEQFTKEQKQIKDKKAKGQSSIESSLMIFLNTKK